MLHYANCAKPMAAWHTTDVAFDVKLEANLLQISFVLKDKTQIFKKQ